MNRTEKTIQLLQIGSNCSQAILAVFGEPHGVDVDLADRLGRPLGAGLGRMGQVCGAVSSAIVVLGLAQKNGLDEAEARNDLARTAQELAARFKGLHGTIMCKDLLGADISTQSGMARIKEEKLVPKLCPVFVRDAADILSEFLPE
ncbi:MAG: C_GCAxxG_C_C family protein [Deltaproteobacteria bacterium]|nr:C_GCAxxG_C_C family protein [Deltaproteobacteria bacterium]